MKPSAKQIKKVMTNIFDGILAESKANVLKKYPELIDELMKIEDPGDFHYQFTNVIDDCFRAALRIKYPSLRNENRLAFLYLNSSFVEQNILYFIVQYGGTACSADKSGYVMNQLVKYFVSGKEMNFVRTKKDKEGREEEYWIPTFWTDDEWLTLFEALVDLYYGSPKSYLLVLQSWVTLMAKKREEEAKNE